jgi:glycosyltransferase involved in cell wall biosynthesis
MRLRSISLWVPEIGDTGGIQHYSLCMANALLEMFPECKLTIISRNDKCNVAEKLNIPRTKFLCFGHVRGKVGHCFYAAAGIIKAWLQPSDLHIATHPAFCRIVSLASMFNGVSASAAHGVEVWGTALSKLKKPLQRLDAILPVSSFTARILKNDGGLNENRIFIVPDTFHEERFAPGPKPAYLLERHSLSVDSPILLTVGRLAASEAYKGHDQVITALQSIRVRHPRARYIIVGKGDDEPRLKALATHLGQEDAVIFAGFIPDDELPDYYRLSDTFVMPSTGEGFGIVFLESVASGRPCIAGNEDASPEALADGRWGLTVNPRSPSEIADAVDTLFTGNHNMPWLKEPETLHREVNERYGFLSFKRHLGYALAKLGVELPNIK